MPTARHLAIPLALALALLLPAAGGVAAAPAVAGAGATAAGSVHSAERLIRRCANQERSERGLAPLTSSPKLGRAARMHARNMSRQGFFDHDDPAGRGPAERVALFDPDGLLVGVGENIAAGYRSVRAACRGWMRSPGHRENILDPGYTRIGAGYARGGPWGTYFVQVFSDLEIPEPPAPEEPPAGEEPPVGGDGDEEEPPAEDPEGDW